MTYAWDDKPNNDYNLYRQQHQPIIKNLTAKKARGIYKHPLAVRLFGYLVETGAKEYTKQFYSIGTLWHAAFPKLLRDTVAEELAESFESEYALGNYDVYVPKKYTAKKKALRRSRVNTAPTRLSGIRR